MVGDAGQGYEVRRDVDGEVAVWAVTWVGGPPTSDEGTAATFSPLEQHDARLAGEVAGVLVDELLQHGGLSERRKGEALAQLRLHRGVTPAGTLLLAADLPLGEGRAEHEWDGSHAGAREIAVAMGEVAGRNISIERTMVGPTGWEPEYDGTGTSP